MCIMDNAKHLHMVYAYSLSVNVHISCPIGREYAALGRLPHSHPASPWSRPLDHSLAIFSPDGNLARRRLIPHPEPVGDRKSVV